MEDSEKRVQRGREAGRYEVLLLHLLRGVDSARLQILLTGTCRQCASWCVAGYYNHRTVIGREIPFVRVSTAARRSEANASSVTLSADVGS